MLSDAVLELTAQRRRRRVRAVAAPRRTPVLFVPGVLGTTLLDPAHRDFPVWGDARGVLFYRSEYEDLDLPLAGLGTNRLRPGDVLWHFGLIPNLIGVPVYEEFARSLAAVGCARGAADQPRVRGGLYGCVHDWRRGIVEGARAIETAVERLQRELDAPTVHLVGHSWGSTLIRYYLRYGGADVLVEPAETPRPGAPNIQTFFAVGAAYGGSLRAFYEMHAGFAPAGPVGRGVQPHHVVTSPSAYQLLRFDADLVVDQHGTPLPVDLADVETWRRFQWGPFAPGSAAKLLARARRRDPSLSSSAFAADIEGFLDESLRRARRCWELLRAPLPVDEQVRTVTFAARNVRTLNRLVVVPGSPAARTLSTDTDVARELPALLPAVTELGDGYVGFDAARQQSSYRTIVQDPENVPADSYLLDVRARNHRDLFKTDSVLVNMMLNLVRYP